MPGVHDAADEINDLQRLLDGARVGGPLVLVGHSYGGCSCGCANAHPSETAGVVLVESMGQDRTGDSCRSGKRRPRVCGACYRKPERPSRDGVDLRASQALATKISTLGDTPLG